MRWICLVFMFAIAATGMIPRTVNGDSDSDRTRILMIASKAEAKESEKAIRSIRAQLSDLDIDLQVVWIQNHSGYFRDQTNLSERLSEQHNATIVFWSDLSIRDQVFLYLSEPGGGRILVRSIPFENDKQGDRFDVIALIVRSVVEAITNGGQIGVSTPPPSAPLPSVKAADTQDSQDSSTTSKRFSISAAYGLTLYSETKLFIHGVRLALAARVIEWGWLFLAYRIQIPFEVKNELVTMTLRPHPFEIGFTGRLEWGGLFLDFGAGLVNDPLSWQVKPAGDTPIAPVKDQFRWLVGATPFVQLNWSPSLIYKLFLAVSADIYFNESPSFTERLNGDETTIVDPFSVRPHLQIGVAFYM